ncbi:hypothetical protein ACFUC2_18830, partial [[Kitasatospora] papulosa]|uniref:hypothetical protein n=1 Tax=[Kitasatospora] papulosa TaxID=1464011 RepID=UPI003634B7F8
MSGFLTSDLTELRAGRVVVERRTYAARSEGRVPRDVREKGKLVDARGADAHAAVLVGSCWRVPTVVRRGGLTLCGQPAQMNMERSGPDGCFRPLHA